LHGATENAQDGGGNGVLHLATIFSTANIQAVVGAIFDAPVLSGQFDQTLGGGPRTTIKIHH
jgi:hypothetical protein